MARPPLAMLSGLRVLSFTQFLLGPAAVQYLADLGADVIKVEPPGAGAWERTWAGGDTFLNGVSAFFLLSHRNVRSLTLNLKHPDARAVARRLVAEADVLVENFRPGVVARFGLDYETVRQINPRIIYASASGYGPDGPYRDLPGQDLLVQAVSGLAAATGRAGDLPTPAGAAVVDQHGAALLAMAVLGALLHRERTGEGQKVEVTMVQAALDLQLEPIVYFLNGGTVERPHADRSLQLAGRPPYLRVATPGRRASRSGATARVRAEGDPMSETRFFEDFQVGESFQSSGRTITDADIRLFIGATGDDHPNHTDAEFARRHPVIDRPCAQGVLVLSVTDAFIAEAITRTAAPCLNYGHDRIRYLKPVYPGDTVRAEITITACEPRNAEWGLITVEAQAKNQRGELVLVNVNKLLVQRRSAAAPSTTTEPRP